MAGKKDIISEENIKTLVDEFYGEVNKDDLLSPIFNNFAKVDWDHHLPIMYKFWGSLLLGSMSYKGSPFPKHLALPIEKKHFDRWVLLFVKTIDDHFSGPIADDAKSRAMYIAQTFQYKMGISD